MWDELIEPHELDPEPIDEPPSWRRRTVMWIAAVVAVAMISVPVWNVLDAREPPLANNGLEICGPDYCDVFDAVREAGYDTDLIRLSNTFISDEEARLLTEALVEELGEDPVSVEILDRLPGATAGRYFGSERLVQLERPVRVWTVIHEAAHTASAGHEDDFQETVLDLVDWLKASGRIE